MIEHFKRLITRNLVSPYGLAFFSYAIFLFAWCSLPLFTRPTPTSRI